jgi:hypothetical protein
VACENALPCHCPLIHPTSRLLQPTTAAEPSSADPSTYASPARWSSLLPLSSCDTACVGGEPNLESQLLLW